LGLVKGGMAKMATMYGIYLSLFFLLFKK
jgi:hypothetical protein